MWRAKNEAAQRQEERPREYGWVVRLNEGPSLPLYTGQDRKRFDDLADAIARQLQSPQA
jgi:hypothetical protein